MKRFFNVYLFEYALTNLLQQKWKNFFIFFILSLLIFLLSSIFFIANSIKSELHNTLDSLPHITIQKLQGGKPVNIDSAILPQLAAINGVEQLNDRIWGYYYFANADVIFTIVGVDLFDKQYKKEFESIVKEIDYSKKSFLYIGSGVKKILDQNYYTQYFNFIKPNGTIKKIDIDGVFHQASNLESNDIMILSRKDAREILGIEQSLASDITLHVSNPLELDTIKQKIQTLLPNSRIITKEDLKISYQNIFDYKSGMFLALLLCSLTAFFIIIYDKASGVSSWEKKNIGILKAIGWKVDDILKTKFYESFIISFFAYFLGITFALCFVYTFNAPLLQNIFVGFSDLKSDFNLPFVLDLQTLSIVFFITIPVYIASIIVPSWKIATLQADEIIR
jgi:ABC-type lipoprotein release transport system permease subunit